MQTHVFTYRYYNVDDWVLFGSEATNTQKFNRMRKIRMNDFGLRFPSGQTYRIGLSTIIEASKMTPTPTEAFDMMEDFVREFRMIRAQNEGKRFCLKGFLRTHSRLSNHTRSG